MSDGAPEPEPTGPEGEAPEEEKAPARGLARLAFRLGCALAILVVAIALLPNLGVPRMGCREVSFDIAGGRCRSTWYLCFAPVHSTVEETRFGQFCRAHLGEPGPPEWRPMRVYLPIAIDAGGAPYYEPDSTYGAVLCLDNFVGFLEEGRFTDAATEAALQGALEMLRRRVCTYGPGFSGYLAAVRALSEASRDAAAPVEVADLPAVPER